MAPLKIKFCQATISIQEWQIVNSKKFHTFKEVTLKIT